MCLWRPEVDTGYLHCSLSNLFIEQGLSLEFLSHWLTILAGQFTLGIPRLHSPEC